MSLRRIAPGEEFTYDYNLYDGDEDDARCHCGAAACRQAMYSPEEIARRKKAQREKPPNLRCPAGGKSKHRPAIGLQSS